MTAAAAYTGAVAEPSPVGSLKQQTAPSQHSVAACIDAMAAAVQRGDFAGAEATGTGAAVNLALPRSALQALMPLSEGAQASVYRAQLCPARLVSTASEAQSLLGSSASSSGEGDGCLAVAVKRPRIRESADLERFRREVALLAQLQGHPHIVHLLGARMLPPDYVAVLQLEASNAAEELHGAGWRPSWARLLALGAQLASAVAYVHAAGYVHRDIKPANVLLSADRSTTRLADLGLAASIAELTDGAIHTAKPTGGFHKQHMVGTLQYLAPEVLLRSPHSPSADVFALAVTLNELASGAVPYSDCTRDNPLAHTVLEMGYGRQELAAAVAAEGLRPTLRSDTPPAVATLLEACWAREPVARPSAADVAAQLLHLAAEAAAAEAAGTSPAPVVPTPLPCEGLPAAPVLPQRVRQQFASDGASASKAAAQHIRVYADAPMPDADAGGDDFAAGSSPSSSDGGSLGGASPSGVASLGSSCPSSTTGGLPCWMVGGGGPGAALRQGNGSSGQQQGTAGVTVGTFLSAGRRDAMEDTLTVLHDPFAPAGLPGCTALGVFDGHRGASAAEYLAASLQGHLTVRLASSCSGAELLAGALLDADVAFRAQQDAAWAARLARMGPAAGARPAPGATATLLLVYPGAPQQQQQQRGGEVQQAQQEQQRMLAVANLGDSRVVLCRNGQAVALTRDHTADLPDERQRIAAAGGACSVRAGGWRVGDAGLQVTRSVGDADLKACGVSAEAEAHELALTPGDAFLIAATDGLWDRLSNEEAIGLVQDTVKHPAMCAQRLVTEALARGGGDNVACAVAFLNTDGSTAERVYHAGHLKYGAAAARRAAVALSADELRDTY